MIRIKICGITNVDDALLAADAGADAIGLNFYPRSPRFIDEEVALAVVGALPAGVMKVGVFVNADAAEVRRIAEDLDLDLVQLHGDEPPEYLAGLADLRVIRAFRVGSAGTGPIAEHLDECRRLKCLPAMILVDAARKGQYGGTGQTVGCGLLASLRGKGWPPLVLAGGLAPENVAEAIRQVRPAAVDTASGVESAPGRKDPDLVRRFVAAARGAFGDGPR
jgi:phosphoribosylanthranilate isomerase